MNMKSFAVRLLPLLLLAVVLCTSCSATRRLPGEAPTREDPSVEGGMNNESQNTKFSSYSRLDEHDQSNYTDIHAYIRAHVSGTYRGPSSVNSGIHPIYVVDGLQVESIDGMSPMEVYSVEFIKDSSAAIYGFRGVNGVYNIVTKAAHRQREAQAEAKKAEREARKAAREAKKAERAARKAERRNR